MVPSVILEAPARTMRKGRGGGGAGRKKGTVRRLGVVGNRGSPQNRKPLILQHIGFGVRGLRMA